MLRQAHGRASPCLECGKRGSYGRIAAANLRFPKAGSDSIERHRVHDLDFRRHRRALRVSPCADALDTPARWVYEQTCAAGRRWSPGASPAATSAADPADARPSPRPCAARSTTDGGAGGRSCSILAARAALAGVATGRTRRSSNTPPRARSSARSCSTDIEPGEARLRGAGRFLRSTELRSSGHARHDEQQAQLFPRLRESGPDMDKASWPKANPQRPARVQTTTSSMVEETARRDARTRDGGIDRGRSAC